MKKSKTLLIGIPLMIILICIAGYKYGYSRVREDMRFIREDQAVKTALLDKYVALISEKPRIEKELSSLKAERLADDSKLIEGQTPSLSAASLQEAVRGIVSGRGGAISSERVVKPETLGKFTVVTVSMDVSLPDSRALSDVLYSLETRTPYLIVKELDARIKNPRDPRDLMIKLDVSALTGGI